MWLRKMAADPAIETEVIKRRKRPDFVTRDHGSQLPGHEQFHQQSHQDELLSPGSAESWPDEPNVARGAEMPRFNFRQALARSSSVDQHGQIIPPICRNTSPAPHSFGACILCPSLTS